MELNINVERIVCSGHSAGGHITAMLLTTDWRALSSDLPTQPLRAGVSVSGIFDLEPISKAPFLQSVLALDAHTIASQSPIHHQPTRHATLLTAVGELESSEFHRQSELLKERWSHSTVEGPMIIKAANHFDVCDIFADASSDLFGSTCALFAES